MFVERSRRAVELRERVVVRLARLGVAHSARRPPAREAALEQVDHAVGRRDGGGLRGARGGAVGSAADGDHRDDRRRGRLQAAATAKMLLPPRLTIDVGAFVCVSLVAAHERRHLLLRRQVRERRAGPIAHGLVPCASLVWPGLWYERFALLAAAMS